MSCFHLVAYLLVCCKLAGSRATGFGAAEGQAATLHDKKKHDKQRAESSVNGGSAITDKLFLTYTEPNMGRMANQLFMIAAAMGIAHRVGYDYCHGLRALDTEEYRKKDSAHKSKFWDMLRDSFDWSVTPRCTDSVIKEASQYPVDASAKSPTDGPGKFCHRCGIGGPPVWEAEQGTEFRAQVAARDKHIQIYGYGQQHIYLNQTIAQEGIKFSPLISKQCYEIYDSLKITGISVAMHVRRGDGAYQTSWDYFESAITILQHRLGGVAINSMCFVIATDDSKWVEKTLVPKLQQRGATCIHFKPQTPAVDMCLLTQCQHAILSGGTFSYMVGYLKRSLAGLVLFDRTHFRWKLFRCGTRFRNDAERRRWAASSTQPNETYNCELCCWNANQALRDMYPEDWIDVMCDPLVPPEKQTAVHCPAKAAGNATATPNAPLRMPPNPAA
jgi:hypothetical protein